MKVTLDCPICGTHNLGYQEGTSQCSHCGYCTTETYKGLNENSEQYIEIQEDIKPFVKFIDQCMWIPSIIQMPNGTILPANIDDKLHYEVTIDNKTVYTCELFSEAVGYIIQTQYGNQTKV